MNSKWLWGVCVAHFGLSCGAWFGLYALAQAAQDSGATTPALGWLELAVNFVLLQPAAYWLFGVARLDWWTWPGFAGAIGLIALNSLVVAGLLWLLSGAERR